MNITDGFIKRAQGMDKKIVLPEGEEERTIRASEIINKKNVSKVVLLGNPENINKKAGELGVNLSGIEIIDPKSSERAEEYSQKYFELRQNKGVTIEKARELMQDEVFFGTMMVYFKEADGLVAGAIHSTGETVRPALQIIKTKPGIKTVSSCFIMSVPDCQYGNNGVFVFADCGVTPDPNASQLAEIAVSSAKTAEFVCEMKPKVAMLSFSTKGSAKHAMVDKVVEATEIAKSLDPGMEIDGELQGDAALVEKVGALKSPGSPVAGKANVLVFPDLQSGNISYKLVQRLAKAQALGPILQGLNMPVNDLSRGCNVDDIVLVTAITAIQASE